MTDLEIQKLTQAIQNMPAPSTGGEWSVFAILVLFLLVSVVFLVRWLVRVQERSEERASLMVKETTAALTGNTHALSQVTSALDRLSGEVRKDHSHSQPIHFPHPIS